MFKYPDSPVRGGERQLEQLKGYIGTLKFDGLRMVALKDNFGLLTLSKQGNKLKTGGGTRDIMNRILLPGMELDCEYMPTLDSFFILGIRRIRGIWIGGETEEKRWNLLRSFSCFSDYLPRWSDGNLKALFELSKEQELCEGIVLKKKGGSLIGSPIGCAMNSGWIKIRWLKRRKYGNS
jgi:hypothetical protein